MCLYNILLQSHMKTLQLSSVRLTELWFLYVHTLQEMLQAGAKMER